MHQIHWELILKAVKSQTSLLNHSLLQFWTSWVRVNGKICCKKCCDPSTPWSKPHTKKKINPIWSNFMLSNTFLWQDISHCLTLFRVFNTHLTRQDMCSMLTKFRFILELEKSTNLQRIYWDLTRIIFFFTVLSQDEFFHSSSWNSSENCCRLRQKNERIEEKDIIFQLIDLNYILIN